MNGRRREIKSERMNGRRRRREIKSDGMNERRIKEVCRRQDQDSYIQRNKTHSRGAWDSGNETNQQKTYH